MIVGKTYIWDGKNNGKIELKVESTRGNMFSGYIIESSYKIVNIKVGEVREFPVKSGWILKEDKYNLIEDIISKLDLLEDKYEY